MYDELIFVYIQVLSAEYNIWKNMLSGQITEAQLRSYFP